MLFRSTVVVDGVNFSHTVTQANIDTGDVGSAAADAIETLIDNATGLVASAYSYGGKLQLTANSVDTPFNASATWPSGYEIVVTGAGNASFTATIQVDDREIESHTVAAETVSDATTAQVTRVHVDQMHGPDTVEIGRAHV